MKEMDIYMSKMELVIVGMSNILPERDISGSELRTGLSGTNISLAVFYPYAISCPHRNNSARILDLFIDIAQKNIIRILTGPLLWEEKGEMSYRSFLLNDGGEITGSYDSCHLAYDHEDRKNWRRGNNPFLFFHGDILFSLADLPDLLHPEFFRVLALSGVEAVIVSSHGNLGGFSVENINILCRARAIENQMYIIAPLGPKTDSDGPGRKTLVFEPNGQMIRTELLSPNIERIEVNSSLVSRNRKKVNILGCRNRKVYHPLTEL